MTITEFRGAFGFLSNFYRCRIVYRSQTWMSAEHAYQAEKTTDFNERIAISRAPTPGTAKRMGRALTMRDDWNDVRLEIMGDIVRAKFRPGTVLAGQLIGTGDTELTEGNRWGDRFWGVSQGGGENHLGKILMEVRNELGGIERAKREEAASAHQ